MIPKMLSLFVIVAIFSSFTRAGDYLLTISDNPASSCPTQARRVKQYCEEERAKGKICNEDLSWPIHTSDEVIESLRLYFSGKDPKIKILFASFSNGHLKFCSKNERIKIYNALQEIRTSGKATNKRHLNDFINILGKNR